MKSENYSKIKEILTTRPDDAQLFVTAGLLSPDEIPQRVTASLASKYYDLSKVKKEILDEVGGSSLKDLEFEPGRYEYAYDFLGSIETAARTFGLKELGIEETDSGYKLGDDEADAVENLEFIEDALNKYAEQVAKDLNDQIQMPGVFYFGFNSDFGDGAYRLFYAFSNEDIPELQELGCQIEQPATAQASFSQILAELEQEGHHDVAVRLHKILRGQ